MKFYLVEDFDPNLRYDQGEVISVDPLASLMLEKNRIRYSLLENYYRDTQIRKDEDHYFLDELRWFDEFDKFLKEHIEECRKLDIRLARAHYNRIKYLVDSVIFRSKVLLAFLQKAQVSELIYVRNEKDGESEATIYNFDRKDRRSYWDILQLFVKSKTRPSFSLKKVSITSPTKHNQSSDNIPLDRFKPFLRALHLKPIYHFFRYRKIKRFLPRREKDLLGKKFLFLDSGSEAIDSVLRNCIWRGGDVFLKNERETRKVSSVFEMMVLEHPREDKDVENSPIYSECQKASQRLGDSDLLDWIDRQCSFAVRELVVPYIHHFVEKICPNVLLEMQKLIGFYSKTKVDFVVTRGCAGANYPGALLAAKLCGVKRVCFQHSVGPLDMKDWVVDELDSFDVNFAMNSLSEDYFKSYAGESFLHPCEVSHSDHYLKKIERRYKKRMNSSRSYGKKGGFVFYVPAKLAHGMFKFNAVIYPTTWYFEHQKKLLKFFGERKDFKFVYKHSQHQKWAEQAVLPWLEEQNLENIAVKDKLFSNYLGEADRAIFDYPSTGFFEAAAAGIPVLALYHESMKVWPPMLDALGKSLQKFSNSKQAIEKIDEFLNSDPEDYVVNLTLSDNDAIKVLIDMKNAQGGPAHVPDSANSSSSVPLER